MRVFQVIVIVDLPKEDRNPFDESQLCGEDGRVWRRARLPATPMPRLRRARQHILLGRDRLKYNIQEMS